ncbi:hypothetical protein Snas_4677 [Stackebrandtia nassauensis DSM 44728]|uniref:Uncharacterized protein n=1 Tax=Stackebrandtia nassauensis (strain DSM 44728 / CIP 108903 / NRRL B-16338 / NBRC 102104 / LLR-40K-21) TaxID=446470 RepID=D3Q7H8_STANL|nr:hypothetical protein Snas_4677 [Stackebrandtia nassauensis DSM 44728]
MPQLFLPVDLVTSVPSLPSEIHTMVVTSNPQLFAS